MRARSPESAAMRLAARQHGVITSDEAASVGMSASTVSRRVEEGKWIRIHPRVYRISGTPATWLLNLTAAAKWAGDCIVSHRSAAALERMQGIPPGVVELTVARNVRPPSPEVILHYSPLPPSCDVRTIEGLRVTKVSRTLIDLAGVVGLDDLTAAFDDAWRRNFVSVETIQNRLRTLGPRHRGIAALRELLVEREGLLPLESLLEAKLLRLILKARLPKPVNQFVIRAEGRFVSRVDFAYPEARLAIEALGHRYHGTPNQMDRDIKQRNDLERLDWGLIETGWRDVTQHGKETAALIRSVLQSRLKKLA